MELCSSTIFLVTIAVNVTLTIALTASGSRTNRDGFMFWGFSFGLHSLAFVLFSLSGEINNFNSIIVATITLSSSWAMFAEGLFQFQQRLSPRKLIWLPVVLISITFFLFQENDPVRISIGSFILCAQTLILLIVLNQGRRSTAGRGQYFIAIGLAPAIPAFLFRGFLAATGDAEKVLISTPNQIQAVSLLISIVSIILVAIGVLIMSKEQSEDRSRLLAVEDQLTGLANRRSIDDTLKKEWARASRHERPLALIMLDVDFFKKYNDCYGHQSGDQCLKDISSVLQDSAQRANDLAARYGGEEFLLILPDTDHTTAQLIAKNVCGSIAELKIPHEQSTFSVVTASAGISVLSNKSHKDIAGLLRAADLALYQAKQNGRNQAQLASDPSVQGSLDYHA
jgi:diguanylate cyclase (GGDEF)-like protein